MAGMLPEGVTEVVLEAATLLDPDRDTVPVVEVEGVLEGSIPVGVKVAQLERVKVFMGEGEGVEDTVEDATVPRLTALGVAGGVGVDKKLGVDAVELEGTLERVGKEEGLEKGLTVPSSREPVTLPEGVITLTV